jgi:plastocyanin
MQTKTLRRAALPLLLLPALVLPASSPAVTIKGKVGNTDDLLNPVWNEAKDPSQNRFDFREPASTVPPDKRILRAHLSKELCIAVLVDSPPAPQKKKHKMTIAGGRTSPVTIVIAPGDEIEFVNKDPFEHDIYEISGKGGFGEGNMLENGSRAWSPPGPGKYELRDKLAPSVRSWVVVEPKVVKTFFPNRHGEFFGPPTDLEPGIYTLRAYFDGEPVGDAMPIDLKPLPLEQPLKDPLKAGPDKKGAGDKDAPANPPKAGG